MGRHIRKKVVDNTSASTKLLQVFYAYDHWNPVAEWQTSTQGGVASGTLRTHLWGLGLASPANPSIGTVGFQAAGGVGGLVKAPGKKVPPGSTSSPATTLSARKESS